MTELIERLREDASEARQEAEVWADTTVTRLKTGFGVGIAPSSANLSAHYANLALDLEQAADALERLREMRPNVHRHLSLEESFRTLVKLFDDVGESHLILSRRGKVLGMDLPERITLLCERAERLEREANL